MKQSAPVSCFDRNQSHGRNWWNKSKLKLTNAGQIDALNSLEAEVSERSALEHEVLTTDDHLDATFEDQYEIIRRFAL